MKYLFEQIIIILRTLHPTCIKVIKSYLKVSEEGISVILNSATGTHLSFMVWRNIGWAIKDVPITMKRWLSSTKRPAIYNKLKKKYSVIYCWSCFETLRYFSITSVSRYSPNITTWGLSSDPHLMHFGKSLTSKTGSVVCKLSLFLSTNL